MIYFLDQGRFFHRYIEIGNNEGEDMHTVQRIVVTVVIVLFYMTSVSFAEDIFLEEQDGMIYYCGDRNYPLWSMGNRVAAVADLSSAYIADENEKWRLIGFLSFPVLLNKNDYLKGAIALNEEIRECWFWQKMKTGDFFFYRDGRPGNKVEGEAFLRELSVYSMLLEAAELNAADF
jgi:hypothetical protein